MAQSPPQYTYSPPPAELPYYNALFSAADKSSAGYLSGPSAVEFLSLSKLPVDLLKQIWTMADQPQSNTLDAKKFFVAVRLIQLFQNGKKPIDLALNLGEADRDVRAPFFEGVDIQQAMQMLAQQQQQQQQPPMQQQQQQQPPMQQQKQPPMQQQPPTPQMRPQQPQISPQKSPQPLHPTMNGAPPPTTSTTLTVQDPYTMTPQELSRYEALFPSYAAQDPDGKMSVTGAVAVELFSKSGLDRESLKTIWTMVDDPIDNKLDSIEFSVAMHLIVCITKKGLPMPPGELPGSLKGTVNDARKKQQQAGLPQQQTAQAGMPQQQLQQQPPPSTPGGIPSPDKRPNTKSTVMMQQQQPHMMNGEMQGMQQQTGQLSTGQGPQLQQQPQQPPQQPLQPHHPPQPQMQQPQMGMGNFGGESVGGHTVDDAFAGLSNEPVTSVDEYSTIGGGPEGDEGGSGGMSMVGEVTGSGMSTMSHETDGMSTIERMGRGMSTISGYGGKGGISSSGGAQLAPIAAVQEIATPESSPQPTALAVQAAMPPLPLQQQQQQLVQQHQQQQRLLPPKAPCSPRVASPARAPTAKTVLTSEERTAELLQLREAHQKLQAEVISLRAKAASVDEEEQETQMEIGKLAGEIVKLSLELSEAKEVLMEKKAKLAESVITLKTQLEKKESLQEQITDAREMHENLTAATEGVSEANDVAIAQQAKAVAAAAAAKEKEEFTTPPQQLDTADLFSWDAPAPTAAPAPASVPATAPAAAPPAAAPAATPMSTTQEPNSMGMDFWGSDSHSVQEPAPAPRSSHDDSSVAHSMHSKQDAAPPALGAAAGVPPALNIDDHDNFSAFATGSSNLNPYGDMFGNAMGGAAPAPPQPVTTPMSSNHAPSTFPGTAPAATPPGGPPTSRSSFTSTASAPAPPPAPAGPPSPTKAELEALKTETVKKEKSFQTTLSLVRSISVEVEQLESQAEKAETEMKAMEGKAKKGAFGGKKKKAKKEYEKAMLAAQQERNKVREAKAQLVAAEREADRAKKEMEEFRQKFEQMELEAATAASVLSVQQNNSMNTSATSATAVQPNDSQSMSGMSTAGQSVADQYNDPFAGMMNHAPPPPTSTKNDPYGMGLMGGAEGGNYSNPFTM